MKVQTEKLQNPPIALNGVINQPKEVDFFQFAAEKGKTYVIKCVAQRIGSGLDPLLNIYSPVKKNITGSDDFGGNPDSQLEFKATVDGNHFVRVRDHRFRGQPNFVYRVEIVEKQPEISFGIKQD